MYNIPILFNIFNRPNPTQKVLSVIRDIQPKVLYIHADGPRADRLTDAEKCAECRDLVMSMIDWDCDVHTWFEKENKGCGRGPADSISWFFQNVEYGIILEDDCVPNHDFFRFSEEMLLRYQNNPQITSIAGSNFQDGHKRGNASYYYSRHNRIWGWATWRRVWEQYDYYMSIATPDYIEQLVDKCFVRACDRKYWKMVFSRVVKDRMEDSCWDYQFMFLQWQIGGLTITPNKNLVSNIGDDPDATHTNWVGNPNLNRKTEELYPLRYNDSIRVDNVADNYYMDNYILYRKNILQRIGRKMRKLFRGLLSKFPI